MPDKQKMPHILFAASGSDSVLHLMVYPSCVLPYGDSSSSSFGIAFRFPVCLVTQQINRSEDSLPYINRDLLGVLSTEGKYKVKIISLSKARHGKTLRHAPIRAYRSL